MTILHVTDFHFNQRWFHWLRANAPEHDLLVMSGDMLALCDAAPHQKQIDWVSNWIHEYPRPMCVCSGNHDLEWDAEAERWMPAYWLRDVASSNVWIDGQRVALDGLSLLNISCTTHPKGRQADIWVVHAAPTNTLVATGTNGRDAGDPDLVGPVQRYAPRVVFSGHIHDPVRWCEQKDSTLYLNPGRNADASFPNHILLKTDDMSCRLVTAQKQEVTPAAGAIEDACAITVVA
jgi:uncharacterized protein